MTVTLQIYQSLFNVYVKPFSMSKKIKVEHCHSNYHFTTKYFII